MLRVAVCDDDAGELERILKFLQEYEGAEILSEAYSRGEDLLASGKNFDILLLDIDMDGLNGIETAKRVRETDKEVKLIYVTNYSDYTIFAFAVHAFAYLLKPLKREELYAQLDEALRYGVPKREQALEFQAKEGIVRELPSDILYFEYWNRQVVLHTTKHLWHLKRKITELAQEMEAYGFAMPHKSFVVNLYAVQNICNYDILLTNGSTIPLSQKKAVMFRRALNEYLADERGRWN